MTTRPFVIHEHVRWGDVDYAGIIRYDAYTRFMELGESEMFRALGVPHRDFIERFDFSIPRRAMHIEFESSPRLDDQLAVVTWISRVGTTSLTLNFDFMAEDGSRRATGHLVLVCVPHATGRAGPWPDAFRSIIAPRCMSDDEARANWKMQP